MTQTVQFHPQNDPDFNNELVQATVMATHEDGTVDLIARVFTENLDGSVGTKDVFRSAVPLVTNPDDIPTDHAGVYAYPTGGAPMQEPDDEGQGIPDGDDEPEDYEEDSAAESVPETE